MATVISRDAMQKHNVHKYSFKVISMQQTQPKKSVFEKERQEQQLDERSQPSDGVDTSGISTSSKDSLIESLMKKTDEMSSNFIKLQMKLEQKEEEFASELKKAKEEAFAEGLEAGKAQAKKEIESQIDTMLELYKSSVEKLNASAEEFQKSLEAIKEDLVSAALDIAYEVVQVELSENSHKVAITLSEALIKELQSASKITLKVNPKDFASLSEHFATLKNIEVVADSAVSVGGVVVMSDAGNRDAQISKRFERVKKAALSE
jgi:flagellar assembly protein FliH